MIKKIHKKVSQSSFYFAPKISESRSEFSRNCEECKKIFEAVSVQLFGEIPNQECSLPGIF
jgi:hypothetical protein